MSRPQSDHYKTLGVPQTATQEEIKKRYRELARRYHPDINPGEEAALKIKIVNEAYHILGDPDRRATYDAERALKQPSAPAGNTSRPAGSRQAPPAGANRRTDTPPRTASPSPGTRPRVDFNGFGTTGSASRRPSGSSAPPPRTAPEAPRAPGKLSAVERLIAEAQLAFINRRYREAEDICLQILQTDRRNAVAHEILGDIYSKSGNTEKAFAAYAYAIQFNPRNYSVQAKLERLGGRPTVVNPGPTMTRPPVTSGWDQLSQIAPRETILNAVTLGAVTLFITMLVLLWMHPGVGLFPDVPWIADLSVNLFGALTVSGVMAGVVLALNGGQRPFLEELMAQGQDQNGQRNPVSLGILLTGFALLSVYLSLAVYFTVSLMRNRFSTSILRVYGVTLFLVALFAFLYHPDHAPDASAQVGIFAGNLLFPTVLFGWAVGDALRLRSR